MEKVRPWCDQPSDRGRVRNRTESLKLVSALMFSLSFKTQQRVFILSVLRPAAGMVKKADTL